jgi:hypothetical protein
VGLLAEDIGLLNEKGSALRLGAATQLVVSWNMALAAHYFSLSGL